MKRRKLPPDKRLNWRDPDMPIIRTGIINGVFQTAEIAPQHVQQYYQIKLQRNIDIEPNWRVDPTYDLKKKKKVLK